VRAPQYSNPIIYDINIIIYPRMPYEQVADIGCVILYGQIGFFSCTMSFFLSPILFLLLFYFTRDLEIRMSVCRRYIYNVLTIELYRSSCIYSVQRYYIKPTYRIFLPK